MEEMVPRFMIGCPGNPSARMMRSVMALDKPPGTVFLDAGMGTPGRQKMSIAEARNGLVRDFMGLHKKGKGLPAPLNWLLMVDGDAVLHRMTLQRLQSWERACVGALCFTRYKPPQPVVYRGVCTETGPDMRSYYVQWTEVREWLIEHPEMVTMGGPALLKARPEDALHSVDWTGTHCLLINRMVFERLEDPWFEMASTVKHGSGSDRLFGEKCKAAGISTWVDYSVIAGHEALMVMGAADFMAWQSISVLDGEEGEEVDTLKGAGKGEVDTLKGAGKEEGEGTVGPEAVVVGFAKGEGGVG